MLAASGRAVWLCKWDLVPAELILMVVEWLETVDANQAGLKSLRLACKRWRTAAQGGIVNLRMGHISCTKRDTSSYMDYVHTSRAIGTLPCVYLQHLEFKRISSLGKPALNGTGLGIFMECWLPCLEQLQRLALLGPLTLSQDVMIAIGNLPKLTHLTLHNVKLPEPYFSSPEVRVLEACHTVELSTVAFRANRALTSGITSDDGQRFFLSMQHMRHLILPIGICNEFMVGNLSKLPRLKHITGLWSGEEC